MNQLILRILRQHLSPWQLGGFTLGSTVGLFILLLGLQFYRDAMAGLRVGERFQSGHYLVLSKEIKGLQGLRGEVAAFGPREVEILRQEPYVKQLGVFEPSRYRVTAGLTMGDAEVYTYMFFEAVPDAFLDVEPEVWQYDSLTRTIPLILPRSYLGLYNSAFATSQGLPQLSETLVRSINIQITINGDRYRGRIVGFSDRLNTLLVPQSFIEWSNEHYAFGHSAEISRVILEVDDVGDKRLLSLIQNKGYQVEGDALESGRSAYLVRLVATAVFGIGLLICLLSVYLLVLSIFLLVARGAEQLTSLLLLGYRPRELSRPYWLLTGVLVTLAVALAALAVAVLQHRYVATIARAIEGYEGAGIGLMLLVALLSWLLLLGVSYGIVHRQIHRLPAYARRAG